MDPCILGFLGGYTLGSLLCIFLKGMHEIQRLISTDLRNIYNWIKDEGILNLKCSRARVARRLLTKCLFKSNKQALNQNLFQ